MKKTAKQLGCCVGAAMLVTGAWSNSSIFEGFDQAEVDYLRADAEANNVEISDTGILGSLQLGRDCRVFFDALDRADAGGSFFDEEVDLLVDRAIDEGKSELAAIYRNILQNVEMGDLSAAREWSVGIGACGDVPREIPGT